MFHRVIPGFMIQGGGLQLDMSERERVVDAVTNESNNGLSNLRGSVAMARTGDPHSAGAQFYINLADNVFLDYGDHDPARGEWGYAVFGRVIEGMEVVDNIAARPTGSVGGHRDVPIEPIVIISARRGEDVPVPPSVD